MDRLLASSPTLRALADVPQEPSDDYRACHSYGQQTARFHNWFVRLGLVFKDVAFVLVWPMWCLPFVKPNGFRVWLAFVDSNRFRFDYGFH